MADEKVKDRFMEVPIEQHVTAAWANEDKTKPVSKVVIPSEMDVRNAKEYVDSNEK
ncbi:MULTISPECIES: CDIF630_02480 family spore surface protein [Clostridium]|uniref:DUF3787 domain-containing protein n=1 Tax=Clostridium paridis TaxID=2803863 RepID=A0A937K3F3_9CLOT|nr:MULTISPECIES: DUF3787 domain-containing protein [Clostridium]MBL4930704.1 DUF3787 domain-containing protein [Clostridium paridis]MDD7795481.1 DUF3787 domain-containing protein [Clostridium sp. 'White wine YQ']